MEGKRLAKGLVQKEREEEEEILLKKGIACHPMFGLLKETHLNCLKVSSGDEEGIKTDAELHRDGREHGTRENLSELDLFMEAYYMALLELKKAIQEPIQEASAFIDFMHCLLGDITQPPTPIIETGSLKEEEELDSGLQCKTLELEAVSEEMGKLGIRKKL